MMLLFFVHGASLHIQLKKQYVRTKADRLKSSMLWSVVVLSEFRQSNLHTLCTIFKLYIVVPCRAILK